LFALKKSIERDTRPFRSFHPEEMGALFRQAGFEHVTSNGQFFWPMVLHRTHRSASVARAMEFVPRFAGLGRWLGSPILALYRRSV